MDIVGETLQLPGDNTHLYHLLCSLNLISKMGYLPHYEDEVIDIYVVIIFAQNITMHFKNKYSAMI